MLFNKNRYFALFLAILCAAGGWYSLILMTETKNIPSPSNQQWYGLAITFIVTVFVWIKKCFTIDK